MINIILVRSIYSSNVGSVARVMANMGMGKLILIDPQCSINSKARQGAAGAQEKLEQRISYSSWDDFYNHEGRGLRIGFTKRDGKQRPVVDFEECLDSLESSQLINTKLPIYLVFGPEDDGLNAEDLELLNHRCSLPTFGEFKSMNLSHACLLACYIAQSKLGQKNLGNDESTKEALYFPEESIKEWLEVVGFNLDARRTSAFTTVRRLLLENNPTENELSVLESILRQNIRVIKELDLSDS